MDTKAQLLTLLDAKVISGGAQTNAQNLRDFNIAFINAVLTFLDNKDLPDGYLSMDAAGNANASKIKIPTPLGYLLSDAGTWKPSVLPLFQSFASVGNNTVTETDLVINALAANTMLDGDKLELNYGGTFAAHVTATRRIKLYAGAVVILDTGALPSTTAMGWTLRATLIRVDTGKVRCMIEFTYGATVISKVAEITGLALGGPTNIKLTGTAAAGGAATNDIILFMSTVNLHKAAL